MHPTQFLLLEFCLLAFIVIAWWVAKRDLTATAARQQSPDLQEVRQILETIEQLVPVLDNKLAEIEGRLQERFDELAQIEESLNNYVPPQPQLQSQPSSWAAAPASEAPSNPIDRALWMIEQGEDPRTVARATGLTISEIETAARMRELRSGRQ